MFTTTKSSNSAATTNSTSRLQELAAFVRKRREAISPADVGLSAGSRRRVKGLRREEVAEIAGISTDWYTWIEQGRDVHLSDSTLQNLSLALRLDEQERGHLYRLAGHPTPVYREALDASVLQDVQNLVDSMIDSPAYALDRYWNILAWNKAAVELFGDFGALPEAGRNMVRLAFTGEHFRGLFKNWDEYSQCTIAHFRADSAAATESEKWLSMIDYLKNESADFDRLWELNNVSWPYKWAKWVNHPTRGLVLYHSIDLEVSRPAWFRVVAYLEQKS